ncbi:MAG TPA: hypothetical protein VIV11_38515 [Kofleriaceae bacterium]
MTPGAAPSQPPPGGPAPAAPKPADPVKSAAIMLVVAAALILIGTISKNWITGGRGSRDIHIGPMGAEACMSSVCVDVPLRGIDGDIEAIMMLAMLSGFASAAAAGTFGGMALGGKKDRIPLPPKLGQIAFGLAAFSMTFFVIRMISEKGEISWAGFPAIGGVILAGVGLKKLTPFLAARPALPPGQQAYPNQSGQVPPNQSQPMQPHPYANQSGMQPHPYANQSQPMPPNQSQPMQPNPFANQSGMQPQPQYGSQPHGQPQQGQPYVQPHGQPQPGQHGQPYAQQPYGQQHAQQPHAQQPHAQQPHAQQPYAQQPHAQQPHAQQPHAQQPHAPQQAGTPNCPRCGTQLHYVAQYQRWFCPREQQYV